MVCSLYRSIALRLAGAIALAAAVAGCGEPGAPQPPSLNLAQPVRDLTATRSGNTVHLAWKSVDRTTDHTPMKGPVRTHICRIEGTGPCELVTDLPLKLGQASQFDDTLPSEEAQGQPQLLTYYIELLNHARKSAGRSNAAYSASGQAAPELSSLTATLRAEGVELHWAAIEWPSAVSADHLVRITRLRLDDGPARPKPVNAGGKSLLSLPPSTASEVPLQTLEVPLPVSGSEARSSDRAIDRATHFGESYQYQALCVEKLMLDGHPIEFVGKLSESAAIFTKDVFPPAVPQQLAAVGDASSHAIDLSWSPDSEPDLAGYVVYRREASGGVAERISGAAPLVAPAFHDAQVQAGVAYVYGVSAVDQSGNESARSADATETVESPR